MSEVPSLDLRSDCLVSPRRMDLAVIEATMLWPHDIERRRVWIAAAAVHVLKPSIPTLPPRSLRDYAEVASETPLISSLQPDPLAYRNGLAAGLVLRHCVRNADLGNTQDATLGKAYAKISEIMSGTGFRMTPDYVRDAAWRDYKAVAHLWSAMGEMEKSDLKNGITPVLPCRLVDLHILLKHANYLRSRAGEIVPPHGKQAILPLSESTAIPELTKIAELSTSPEPRAVWH